MKTNRHPSSTVDEVDDGDALLGLRTVRPLVGDLSPSTIERRVAAGTFPKPVVLSRGRHGRATRVAWVRREILEWCREQLASGRVGPGAFVRGPAQIDETR